MDWADDIAYSVHDIEDFHRCGAIPWERILRDSETKKTIVAGALKGWHAAPPGSSEELEQTFDSFTDFLNAWYEDLVLPYEGTRHQRQMLRTLTGAFIERFIGAASLSEDEKIGVFISNAELREVKILKQIMRDYVISRPALQAQQKGQKKVISYLYEEIFQSVDPSNPKPPSFLPRRLSDIWELRAQSTARFAADCVSSLTEKEAVNLYGRLSGSVSGSVLDPLVR